MVLNKADLADATEKDTALADHLMFNISAKTGLGIEKLKSALRAQLVSGGFESAENVIITNMRI